MKINKLVLYNFNSYEGLNEFDFTSNSDKRNIVLIGGKNGAGKTSLFTAIKIALYGPLSFGYVGVNPVYISKIKECINSKSFQKDIVESRVQLSISLMVEREVREYEITREWNYTKQRLEERYYVKRGNRTLDEQEVSYFQNYLQGILPPDLFEFFLFDGEEVGNIFSTSSYNSYIKNAIYMLCGLDIFEIIRKYTTGYAGKSSGDDEDSAHTQYEELRDSVEELEGIVAESEANLISDEEKLEKVETDLIELETAFKKAGGITEQEKQTLLQELAESERIKTEALTKIKLFVEGLMPFYILRDFTTNVTKQLDFEEKSNIYHYVQQKIDHQAVERKLAGFKLSGETIDTMVNCILEEFMPDGYTEGVRSIHDLSKEEINRVNAVISSVNEFDRNAMVELVKKRKAALDRTMEINRILKGSMTDEDSGKYAAQENELLKSKEEIAKRIYNSRLKLAECKEQLLTLCQQRDRAYQNLRETAQNKHVFELSSGLSQMMASVLNDKSESINRGLEELIVQNLKRIYRKDNLVTHIEIEDNFQFDLYQNAKYTVAELMHLIKNVGKDAFATEIGKKGMDCLLNLCKVSDASEVNGALMLMEPKKKVDLFKRIDIGRLSKGERQIFILALYWAIIELSGKDIPFVIDTPYARIDANHRKEISQKFFPNISKQVIILSTDEEINEEYYRLLKPYIAKEYLLVNDESENRTTVEKRYFFEV